MQQLLADIAAFQAKHDLSEWQFGEMALNDRHLVRQLREGRDLRISTLARIREFMDTYRPEAPELAKAS